MGRSFFCFFAIIILIAIIRRSVLDEVTSLFSYISSVLKQGMPLVQGLKVYLSGVSKYRRRYKKILSKIISRLENGLPFSKSIEPYKRLFPKSCVSIIRAGEETGNVPEAIKIFNMIMEKRIERIMLFSYSLVMPITVLITLIGISFFVVSVVLPRFVIMFEGFEYGGGAFELPLSTRILIGISGFIGAYYPYIFILAIILTVLWFIGRKTGINEQIMSGMPVIGKLSLKRREAYFCYVLSSLLKSGATLERALELTKETVKNKKTKSDIDTIIKRIKNGDRLSDTLKESRSFSKDLSWACSIGEERDSLPGVLWWLGESNEDWLRSRTAFLMPIVERGASILLGLMVGYFVYSLYGPIFLMAQLSGMVGGG